MCCPTAVRDVINSQLRWSSWLRPDSPRDRPGRHLVLLVLVDRPRSEEVVVGAEPQLFVIGGVQGVDWNRELSGAARVEDRFPPLIALGR